MFALSRNANRIFTLVVFLLAFFPYETMVVATNIELSSVKSILFTIVSVLQIISLFFLVQCYFKAQSRTVKVFWLYLGLAIASLLIGRYLPQPIHFVAQQLQQDFIALFAYFFILLAIEINPHVSDVPLNKYTAGRIPALLFSVIIFSYLILLPSEFAETIYVGLLPSLLFHIVLDLVILLRLLFCLINSSDDFWRYIYALLSLALGIVLIDNITAFEQIRNNEQSVSFYIQQLVTLLPFTLLIVSCQLSLQRHKSAQLSGKVTNVNSYILLLTLTFVCLHLFGKEFSLFYMANSSLQTIIVFIWLALATTLMLYNIHRQQQKTSHLQLLLQGKNQQFEQLQTQYQHLEHELVNSEYKAIVNVSNNAILTVTTQGKILSANPAAVKMFQALEQELIHSSVAKLFVSDDEMHYFFSFESNLHTLQRKKSGISIEAQAQRFDGSEFPCQVELQWADRESQPLIVITFINLTERKLAEQKTLALKDQFIANISHEFRTPLTIINGIIDRYLSKATTSEEQENLTTAKRNGLRLVRMVEQLLELSRLSDNPKLSLTKYRLSQLMAMPIASFSRLSNERALHFISDIDDDLWLACDAQAFENIIFNLLANAVKYTPKGGTITVKGYQDQETIALEVIDTGIGISENAQSEIFERFQRADDPLNQAVFGVGIGLSLVNELVKAHGWRINLVSEQGQGSKFTLFIPLEQPTEETQSLPISLSEDEVTSMLSEQVTVTTQQQEHSQQVVLVIEDNADMQSHIKQVIEPHHHCILAGSGELGLALAHEYLPDLIVCDLMLTGIDGFEVLTQLKGQEITSHIPVILLTARSDLESRLQGLQLNADEYLSKPFNENELLSRIQNLIENRKKLQQSYLKQFNQQQQAERLANAQHNIEQLTEEDNPEQTLDEQFLHKLEAIVAKYYIDTEFDITILAKELAMSERQLQRKIKVLLGTTPNNFIKNFRLQKAQELLLSGAQIGRIALDVGFSSQTYFGRCFKEQYQCTPKQFQQKNQ